MMEPLLAMKVLLAPALTPPFALALANELPITFTVPLLAFKVKPAPNKTPMSEVELPVMLTAPTVVKLPARATPEPDEDAPAIDRLAPVPTVRFVGFSTTPVRVALDPVIVRLPLLTRTLAESTTMPDAAALLTGLLAMPTMETLPVLLEVKLPVSCTPAPLTLEVPVRVMLPLPPVLRSASTRIPLSPPVGAAVPRAMPLTVKLPAAFKLTVPPSKPNCTPALTLLVVVLPVCSPEMLTFP